MKYVSCVTKYVSLPEYQVIRHIVMPSVTKDSAKRHSTKVSNAENENQVPRMTNGKSYSTLVTIVYYIVLNKIITYAYFQSLYA